MLHVRIKSEKCLQFKLSRWFWFKTDVFASLFPSPFPHGAVHLQPSKSSLRPHGRPLERAWKANFDNNTTAPQTSWHCDRQMPLDTLACCWHLSMHPAAPSFRSGRLVDYKSLRMIVDPRIFDKSDPTWHAPAIAFLHPTRSVAQPIPISTSPNQQIARLRNMLYTICSLFILFGQSKLQKRGWIEFMIQGGLPNRLTLGSVLPSRMVLSNSKKGKAMLKQGARKFQEGFDVVTDLSLLPASLMKKVGG